MAAFLDCFGDIVCMVRVKCLSLRLEASAAIAWTRTYTPFGCSIVINCIIRPSAPLKTPSRAVKRVMFARLMTGDD